MAGSAEDGGVRNINLGALLVFDEAEPTALEFDQISIRRISSNSFHVLLRRENKAVAKSSLIHMYPGDQFIIDCIEGKELRWFDLELLREYFPGLFDGDEDVNGGDLVEYMSEICGYYEDWKESRNEGV